MAEAGFALLFNPSNPAIAVVVPRVLAGIEHCPAHHAAAQSHTIVGLLWGLADLICKCVISGHARQFKGPRLPPSGPTRADVFYSRPWPAVSRELGSYLVEDEQVLVGFDEIDVSAGDEAGDVERGLADLDDAVGGDRDAPSAVPATGCSWFLGRGGLTGFPGDGFRAAPLSVNSRCGTPCAAMPFLTRAMTHSEVAPQATWVATARRAWSSMSWKITHFRPRSTHIRCHRAASTRSVRDR